jgi:hypothetical protein
MDEQKEGTGSPVVEETPAPVEAEAATEAAPEAPVTE